MTRPRFVTAIFVPIFLSLLCPVVLSAANSIFRLDLQPELCDLQSQQAENRPAAGVDFLSEDEVVIYTVCHTGEIQLLKRDDPKMTSPHHLKAIIVDLTTGKIKHRFDWPTRGRGSMLRVTHAGELLSVRDNLIEVMTPDGKPVSTLQVLKARTSDEVYVGMSPALDTLVVAQSTQLTTGEVANSVAVLDSHTLKSVTEWQDEGNSWNVAASREIAVRTSKLGKMLQMHSLSGLNDHENQWDTLWSDQRSSDSKPLFIAQDTFAFVVPEEIKIFLKDGTLRDKVNCNLNTPGLVTSRQGNIVASACLVRPMGDWNNINDYNHDAQAAILITHLGVKSRITEVNFLISTFLDFGLAISPSNSRLAIVDRLKLQVFQLPPQ